MKNLLVTIVLAILSGLMGCMSGNVDEKAQRGPVGSWMEREGSDAMVARAKSATVRDPDMRQMLAFCVTSYLAARESLQKVAVHQDGLAVWNRALASQSEVLQKELKDFTEADRQAAYRSVVAAAQAADATEDAKKDLAALTVYFQWGATLTATAETAARQRNQEFLAAVAQYTLLYKQLAMKYEDKVLMALAIADGVNAVNWLSLAAQASQIEAEAIKNARDAAVHLKQVGD